jgi:hypothetical protein
MGAYILIAPLAVFKIGKRSGGYDTKNIGSLCWSSETRHLSSLGDWRAHAGPLEAFSLFILFYFIGFVFKEDNVLLIPSQSRL